MDVKYAFMSIASLGAIRNPTKLKSDQAPLAHRGWGNGAPASLASFRNISNLSMAYD
jgi:hypothetical protein